MHTFNPIHVTQAREEFTKPTALVLAGPRGCGKTILARMLAAERGTFTEARIPQLINKGHLTRLLKSLPRTIVLDDEFALHELMQDERQRAAMKQLISNTHQVINDRGTMRRVLSPKLIFCTQDMAWLTGVDIGRRFSVVDMGMPVRQEVAA